MASDSISLEKARPAFFGPAFHITRIAHGLIYDRSDGRFPTRAWGWRPGPAPLDLRLAGSTLFGFVLDGEPEVTAGGNRYRLKPGQYFCFHDAVCVSGGSGFLVERLGWRGLDMIGGPVEASGRLRYIDGCTDTLLTPPVKRGDACFNALFFPGGIDQTLHTHPSIRVGMVAQGSGWCLTEVGLTPLRPGQVFVIDQDAIHGFRTAPDQGMLVIAYHPDSDFGPLDEDHPMINRTLVDGVSAALIDKIRTR